MQLINDNFFKKTLNKKSIIGIFVWVDVNALMYLMFSLFCFQKLVFNFKKKKSTFMLFQYKKYKLEIYGSNLTYIGYKTSLGEVEWK